LPHAFVDLAHVTPFFCDVFIGEALSWTGK